VFYIIRIVDIYLRSNFKGYFVELINVLIWFEQYKQVLYKIKIGYYSTSFKEQENKMRKITNPVAKFSARLNYNAGVHEKSNKAKRKSNKQKFMNAFRKGKENYFMSQFA
jgi:hypothetical protein